MSEESESSSGHGWGWFHVFEALFFEGNVPVAKQKGKRLVGQLSLVADFDELIRQRIEGWPIFQLDGSICWRRHSAVFWSAIFLISRVRGGLKQGRPLSSLQSACYRVKVRALWEVAYRNKVLCCYATALRNKDIVIISKYWQEL